MTDAGAPAEDAAIGCMRLGTGGFSANQLSHEDHCKRKRAGVIMCQPEATQRRTVQVGMQRHRSSDLGRLSSSTAVRQNSGLGLCVRNCELLELRNTPYLHEERQHRPIIGQQRLVRHGTRRVCVMRAGHNRRHAAAAYINKHCVRIYTLNTIELPVFLLISASLLRYTSGNHTGPATTQKQEKSAGVWYN